ncbi:MAG: 16S rRNA (guanine(966)-N(2))-methyltransferase RsmD [Verrucomicrobia bacterium]|nr:16S rRNA (guanine(966)-N(2))-methyltransferase RsmD [Verrucomicrobiota bacterium]
MRITGGSCKGRLVRVPKSGLRPTQDQVREALFSILAEVIPGCHFLDLFAGSGAVGLDALSRGAAKVCWVENHPATYKTLINSLDKLGLKGGHPVRGDVFRTHLRALPGAPYDVIFADPPYAKSCWSEEGVLQTDPCLEALMKRLQEQSALKPDGFVIFEQAKRGGVIEHAGWELIRDRIYGQARILIYRFAGS